MGLERVQLLTKLHVLDTYMRMFELAPEDSLEALFSFYEAKVFQSGYLREELEDTRKEAEREKAKVLNNIARTCRTILRKLSITQDTGLRGRI